VSAEGTRLQAVHHRAKTRRQISRLVIVARFGSIGPTLGHLRAEGDIINILVVMPLARIWMRPFSR
jgi:hypothetical protein